MRILTTHVGSLPRPHDLLDLMKARVSGKPFDKDIYEKRVKTAVADCVRKQAESGIDIVTAGADCGFSSQATYNTEVHPVVVWAKFEAMRQGARLATRKLWPKRRS